jgi:hypothetical protein
LTVALQLVAPARSIGAADRQRDIVNLLRRHILPALAAGRIARFPKLSCNYLYRVIHLDET